MLNHIPKYINEICPSCNPRSYEKTLCKFTGRTEEVTFILNDGSKEFEHEYLYQCTKCDALIWVDEQWVKDNKVSD